MRRLLPIRAVALLVVGVFSLHLSRFYLAADITNFVCPHHVQAMDSSDGDHMAMQHKGHQMPMVEQSRPAPRRSDDSGMRCCCRHTLDGLITTLVLSTPADLAGIPLPDGGEKAILAADLSVPESDLSPPFIPPRA